MMRVLWEEWRQGGAYSSLRILPVLVLAAAVALLITQFQPGTLFLILVLGALVGGSLSGTQRWNQVLGRDWVGLEGTNPFSYALGKMLGLILLVSVWAVFLSPPVVMVALLWGLPWELAVISLAWAWAGALAAQALGHLVTWGTSEFQRILGGILTFLWIAGTLQVPETHPFNPVWQIWRQFHDPGTAFDFSAWGLVMGISLCGWAFVALLLRRMEGRK